MSKTGYKIPATLDQSVADMEISLKSGDGMGPKPLPLKVILFALSSVLICFWLVMKTFIGQGPIWAIVIFVLCWVAMTLILMRYDKTKQMQVQMIPALFGYIPKSARHVLTRSGNRANEFYGIVGIESIDDKTGLVTFADGTFGYFYRVVGSASVLLFDSDKDAILRRVDAFYRKMNTDAEIIFMTVKESQKVYRQIANLKRRYVRLSTNDPDLKMLAHEQFDILKHHVGGTFKSIHQYMILKADNKEALLVTKNILQSEVENSSQMIKQCTALFADDIYDVLRMIYR